MINILILFCGTINFASFKPLSKTLLDTHHQTISYLFYDRVQMNQDGSFILAGEWSVWHFDSTGKLIRNFGRKGQGPYEFQYVQKAMWDGTYYWVIDGKTLSIKQFDEAGKFVKSNPKWYLQFLRVNGIYYVEHGIYKKQKKNKGAISVVKPLSSFEESPSFHEFSPTLFKANGNYESHLLASRDGNLYVLNQLDAALSVYSADGTQKKRGMLFQAPGFVGLPKKMIDYDGDIKKWMKFLHSFSKFTGIDFHQSHPVVAYEVPGSEEGTSLLNVISLDEQGKCTRLLDKFPGYFIGCHNGKVMLVSVDERAAEAQYTLELFQ